ncbi:MAG: CBM50 [uncultured Cytophagales bacterium]|uniref:CBM50 n=1 Tax=uncultured Cytophagales bacterium TaxID=158755 RepID=A0A6J4JRW6_9SPHI|nr:MAG: CBM50 [uncultured Cytophagales bacterium]
MSYKVLSAFLFVFVLHTLRVSAAVAEVRRDSVGAERKGNGWLVLHKVGPGESLTALARKYGTTVKAIQQANRGLSAGLKAGAIVKVPYAGTVDKTATAAPGGKKTHAVAAGQGLYAIARIYGVSVADLRTWNKLTSDNLYEGQVLAVSAEGSAPATEEPVSAAQATTQTTVAEEPAAPRKPAPVKTHKVKRNEGLASIARKYKVSVNDLKEWNKLSSSSVKVGKVLRVSAPQKQVATPLEETALATGGGAETATDNPTKTDAKRKPDSKSSVKDGEDDDPTGIQARNQAEAKADQEDRRETRTVSNDAVVANTVGFPKVIEAGLAESISDSGDTEGYYALHRSAPVGTILQVRNEMNNLSVFVKVVGKLPDTGANDKLVVKITQKAYERLAAVDRRFRVEVTYLPN